MDDRLIILKGEDCTDRVRSIRELSDGRFEVYFKGQGKRFVYHRDNVVMETARGMVDSTKYIVQIDGKIENNVKEIKEYGGFYRFTFGTGFVRTAPKSKTKLIGSCLDDDGSKNIFEYYKAIAREVSLYTDDGKNILESYYDRIDFIREDTVLADYFRGEVSENYQENVSQEIFPFGFNPSQKAATENAVRHKISVIQGPPGTGKTQTILNIIANVVKNGKTVAVVSNNNSATDNIHEKLQEYGVDFIAARLGSMKNKQDFILNQYVPAKEKLEEWKLDPSVEREIGEKILVLAEEIDELLNYKNEIAELESELDEVSLEQKYFDEFVATSKKKLVALRQRKMIGADKVLDLWRELGEIDRGKRKLGFWRKAYFYFVYKVKIDRFFEQSYSDMVCFVQGLYYKVRVSEIEARIRELSSYIEDNNLDEKIVEHKGLSLDVFQSHIATRYLKSGEKKKYSMNDLWKRSEDFIKDYPVVLSTTYSLRNSLSYNYVYDYVVVDESSQVDLATFVLALSCAKRVVVVGDEKQLPNVVDGETMRKDAKVFEQFGLPKEYQFSTHSALSAITDLFGGEIPSQFLREHYRCHPKIIEFCNKTFYDGQLIVLTDATEDTRDALKIYTTVKGNHARDDHVNQRQIDVTLDEVVPKEGLNLYDDSVGIVTPYRNQAKALNAALAAVGAEETVLAATVDKFQGRERDIIIINTVDNKISDFASDPNRLNVAVSRAKSQLIVVTNGNDNSEHSGIEELVDYIRYNNFEVAESEVRSVFDYLYTAYYERRKVKNVTEYYSENLMNEVIERVLETEKYRGLECVMQYPLKMLCDVSKLSGREHEYANNDWTMVDFVIFKKTSKIPVLAIEVDGWAYHYADATESEKQKERDLNKNNILKKFEVPLVRFSTTGSRESEVLTRKLDELWGGGDY